VDGLVVSRESMGHPSLPDVYTLGHCDTEAYPSDWAGPDTVRSVLVLYYGSFRNLARMAPDFDWEAEVHETVEHELRHHLESLAGRDELEDVDYAMDESFKRDEGLNWDPWYYQRGEPIGDGIYLVEDQVYVEQVWSSDAFERADSLTLEWKGRTYEIDRPHDLADMHFILIRRGVLDPPSYFELVLVRRRSWWENVRRLLGASGTRVLESEAVARLATRE
jgi:hypothetical protein